MHIAIYFFAYLLSQLATLSWAFLSVPECRGMQFGLIISLMAISDSFLTRFHPTQKGTYSRGKKKYQSTQKPPFGKLRAK